MMMNRNRLGMRLAWYTLLLTLPQSVWVPQSWGQVVVWKTGQKELFDKADAGAVKVAPDASAKEKLIEMTAMPEPSPALKYRFWKTPALRKPGNVNSMMSRAMILYLSHPNRSELDNQYLKHGERWIDQNVADDLLRAHLAEQREILDTLYEAADLETIELRSTLRGKKGVEVLAASLVEVQNLRNLARLIQLDAINAMADLRYDDALTAISSGFRLAEYTTKGGDANLMTGLVSIAISGITYDLVERLSKEPQAPNLYWALASLPEELWSRRISVEGEIASISRVVHPLFEPADSTMTESEWRNRLMAVAETVITNSTPGAGATIKSEDARKSNLILAQMAVGTALLLFSDRAAQELIDDGQPQHIVERMSPSEVVAQNTSLGFEKLRDHMFKWSLLSNQGRTYTEKEWRRFTSQQTDFIVPAHILLGLLLPALQAYESAALRCSTMHKQLLLHESLRAHAAAHNGSLPATLVDLEPVPSWPNPATERLFEYQRISNTEAIVRRNALYPGEKQTDTRIRIRNQQFNKPVNAGS